MDSPTPSQPDALRHRKLFIFAAALVVVLLIIVFVALRAGPSPLPGTSPSLPCGTSSLQLGHQALRIQTLSIAPGAQVSVPSGKPKTAFWLQGTSGHYAFGLSTNSENQNLVTALAVGDPIRIAWGDCSSDDFVVASIAKSAPDMAALLSPSAASVTIFMPPGAGTKGWTVTGQRPEALVTSAPQTLDPNAVQADVSFIDQAISRDGKTLTLTIAIKNTGRAPIHLSEKEITLTAGDATSTAPLSVDAQLPLDIPPGATKPLVIIFAKPQGSTAVFHLLDFGVDLYF